MSEALVGELVEEAPLAVRATAPLAPNTLFSPMRPAETLALATEIADAIKPVLEAKRLVHRLNRQNPQDEFVELEGWQTTASLAGVSCKIEWTRKLEDGNGWEARAVVVRVANGIEVGAGEGMCSRKESKWSNRDEFALRSMAQTRAQSRALRGVLAWVLVLAGYKATPAEEMPPEMADPPKPSEPPLPKGPELLARARRLGLCQSGGEFRAWAKAHADGCDDVPTPAQKRAIVKALDVVETAEEAGESAMEPETPSEAATAQETPATGISESQRKRWMALVGERKDTLRAMWPGAEGMEGIRHLFACSALGDPTKGSSKTWTQGDYKKVCDRLELIAPDAPEKPE
jgi:hypothetical protein